MPLGYILGLDPMPSCCTCGQVEIPLYARIVRAWLRIVFYVLFIVFSSVLIIDTTRIDKLESARITKQDIDRMAEVAATAAIQYKELSDNIDKILDVYGEK